MTSVKEKEEVKLGKLKPARGTTHRKKRLGLGESSGHGKTSGRGTKGQKARSGHGIRPGFEGGTMPLIRRIPKRGFTHVERVHVEIVNVESLNRFPANSVVDAAAFLEARLVHKKGSQIKILGDGSLTRALTVKAHRFSKSAMEKIAGASGKAEQIA